MRFFIPFATDEPQMERIYTRIQHRLENMEYGPFHERVYRLIFRRDGSQVIDTVGELCPIKKETVIAIFKNDRGYMICSYSSGAVGGEPIVVNNQAIEAVDFFEN